MKNNKFLLAAGLLAASSLSFADYSVQTLYQTGNANLVSNGGCKLKRTKFPDAQYGMITDNTTQEVFEGVLTSDNKLLVKFGVQNFVLSDVTSSKTNQDYQRQVFSYTLQPESLSYLIENNKCSFMQDANKMPIIQTVPAQNLLLQATAKFRSKQANWLVNRQTSMRIPFHATTLQVQDKNCSSAINCTRTGLVSNIIFSFNHKSTTTQSDRLLALEL